MARWAKILINHNTGIAPAKNSNHHVISAFRNFSSTMMNKTPALLRCPICHQSLSLSHIEKQISAEVLMGNLICKSGHVYKIIDGIPQLAISETFNSSLELLSVNKSKSLEESIHDFESKEHDRNLVVNEKNLFSFLNYYQIFNIISTLDKLNPKKILVVMCGSGFEFDIWSRLSTNIWGVDISVGCLKNAYDRHRRIGLYGDIVMGDIECLPFVDNSFDLVTVHHGLHHMSSIEIPLTELLRVTNRYCILFEPIDGFMRRLFKITGISPPIEPLGTKVYDINKDKLRDIIISNNAKLLFVKRFFYPRARVSRPTPLFSYADQLRVPTIINLPLKIINILFGYFIGTKGTFMISKNQTNAHLLQVKEVTERNLGDVHG